MLDEFSPLVKKYHDLFMEAPSGSETFTAYADVLIILRQSALEEARAQLRSRLKKYAASPFRRKVYKRGASRNSHAFLFPQRGQDMGKRPVRKETIASLEEKYEDLYYSDAVYEAPGNAGYEVRRLVSSIRSRLRDIQDWEHDDRRLARQKREEAINEFRTWDCLPRRYRYHEWLAWIEQTDLMQFAEIIKERGELLKVNRVAKQAAADIEASNKMRYY